jgi:hypothetical protein
MDLLRNFLLGSDFDQTLRFNDPGVVLSELIGLHSLHNKVKGLAEIKSRSAGCGAQLPDSPRSRLSPGAPRALRGDGQVNSLEG